MDTRMSIFSRAKEIRTAFNIPVAIRNILFVTVLSLLYLLGKHFWSERNHSTKITLSINKIKTK
jgi:hypothetical protein